MPIVLNEPLSFLQRTVEYLEYTDLIKQASDCDDPVKRLEVGLSIFSIFSHTLLLNAYDTQNFIAMYRVWQSIIL